MKHKTVVTIGVCSILASAVVSLGEEQRESADVKAAMAKAAARQKVAAKKLGKPVEIINSIGMKLRLIPAGEFMMGSPEEEKGRWDDESPQHRVRITEPYYLGVTEVTQGQWEAVMGTDLSDLKHPDWHYFGRGSNKPMYWVSWYDAILFCNSLSQQERRDVCYEIRDAEPGSYGKGINTAEVRIMEGNGYRLPTEAEWEYACRGGTSWAYYFGQDNSELSKHAWFHKNTFDAGESYAHKVGQKRPNPFGLYDMYGNVSEWCADWFDRDYYSRSPTNDPAGPSHGSSRVNRGDGWGSDPHRSIRLHGIGGSGDAGICRSANRSGSNPAWRGLGIGNGVGCGGFRVVLAPGK